jgi:large subunit ribosomal protein L21
MSYAIIKTGGKQYKVAEGDKIDIEKLELNEGDTATFDEVLFVSDAAGVKIGDPVLSGATVTGTVLEQRRAKKVTAFKFKRRSGYHKTKGHRQPMTRISITGING